MRAIVQLVSACKKLGASQRGTFNSLEYPWGINFKHGCRFLIALEAVGYKGSSYFLLANYTMLVCVQLVVFNKTPTTHPINQNNISYTD